MINNKRPPELAIDELIDREPKKCKAEPFPILDLPEEIIFKIFSCTEPQAAAVLPLVCQRFHHICQDPNYIGPLKGFDRFLPQINQKLNHIASQFCLTNFDQYKEGLTVELFNIVFNATVTDEEKTWIKYGSRYQEAAIERIVKDIFDYGDDNEELEHIMYQKYINTVRRKYMEIAEYVVEAEVYLPITDSLEKIKKQVTYLKIKEPPAAEEPRVWLDHKINTSFILNCQNLRHLELYEHNLSDDWIRDMDNIFQNPSLKKLTITFTDEREEFSGVKLYKLIAQSTSIQEIVLNSVELVKERVEHLAAMPSLKKLVYINQSNAPAGADTQNAIKAIACFPYITDIVLDVFDGSLWMYYLQVMPSLERLTITNFSSFGKWRESPFPKLKELVIKSFDPSTNDYRLENLISFPFLETVDIHRILTDKELNCLPKSLKTLRCLEGSKFSKLCLAIFDDLTVETLALVKNLS